MYCVLPNGSKGGYLNKVQKLGFEVRSVVLVAICCETQSSSDTKYERSLYWNATTIYRRSQHSLNELLDIVN